MNALLIIIVIAYAFALCLLTSRKEQLETWVFYLAIVLLFVPGAGVFGAIFLILVVPRKVPETVPEPSPETSSQPPVRRIRQRQAPQGYTWDDGSTFFL